MARHCLHYIVGDHVSKMAGYVSMGQSPAASNSQVLARGDHNWSGCGIIAHPAPVCDSREKTVVNKLVLEGSLLLDTVTTDGERLFSTAGAARKAVRICGTTLISILRKGPKLIGPFHILHCG